MNYFDVEVWKKFDLDTDLVLVNPTTRLMQAQ